MAALNGNTAEHSSSERWKCVGFLHSQAVHVAKTGGEAVVVCDDDGGIQRLEVQHDHRVTVEARLGFHHQGKALRSPLLRSLLDAGCHWDVVQRLGHTQHHGLHTVLWRRG